MTREEAREILAGRYIVPVDGYADEYAERVNVAIDLAIEALSEPQIVRCKDCISSRVYGKTTQWLACEDVMEGQATDPD